jgi:hypothetical protein
MTAPGRRTSIAYLALCFCAFVVFAPGRIVFPDDEIVFQTTQSIWERGELSIDGIAKRTGEPKGQPSGTFGWAPGRDGKRYGFFGHALSVAALPMYGIAKATAPLVPEVWRHAVRSDHFFVHARSRDGDWLRIVVSLSNCVITAIAGLLLLVFVRALGYSENAALVTALAYAFGTLALPYSGTFLSEPLSAALLLAGAIGVTRFHALRSGDPRLAQRWLWGAAMALGVSVHAHVLNLVAVPCFVAWAMWPLHRDGVLRESVSAWGGALAIGVAWIALLGFGQWWRFGSAFETGRHGLYSAFIVPGEGLLALVVSPGRSFLLLSPALLVALPGWRAFVRAHPVVALSCVAIVVTRIVFVAARSDWWGGWAIGARFLVPAIPFAIVPLAALWDRLASPRRMVVGLALVGCALMQAHLATYSIFEWMLFLYNDTPESVGYLARSHWEWSASPVVGFFRLEPDLLSVGAVRLARHGHASLAWVFGGLVVLGLVAAAVLVRQLALGNASAPHEREVRQDHAPR